MPNQKKDKYKITREIKETIEIKKVPEPPEKYNVWKRIPKPFPNQKKDDDE